jgi:hypothetical protein
MMLFDLSPPLIGMKHTFGICIVIYCEASINMCGDCRVSRVAGVAEGAITMGSRSVHDSRDAAGDIVMRKT